MALDRTYRQPRLLVRQHFVGNGAAQGVQALLFIAGQHANFLPKADTAGYIGNYDPANGLDAFLPSILTNQAVDTDSVVVSLKNALLQYMKPSDDGNFVIPANSKNQITTSTPGFSLRTNGEFARSAMFGDRDVRPGDVVEITGSNGTLFTKVAQILPNVIAGTVDSIAAGTSNPADVTSASASVMTSTDDASVLTATVDPAWTNGADLLAAGKVSDNIRVTATTGGDATAARFSISSSVFANATGVSLTPDDEGNPTEYTAVYNGITVSFAADAAFTAGDQWVVQAAAQYTAAAVAIGNDAGYAPAPKGSQAREVIYTIAVQNGGDLLTTNPSAAELTSRPRITVTTNDGSDRVSSLRLLKSGDTAIGRYGLVVNFPTGTYIEGAIYNVTVTAPYTSTYPTIVLSRNLPAEWVSDTDQPVSVSLFIANEFTDIPAKTVSNGQIVESYTFSESDNQIHINGGLLTYDDTFTVEGVLTPLPVVAGQSPIGAYMSGRYFVNDLVGKLLTIGSAEELELSVSGPTDPSNPLKYAAAQAMGSGEGASIIVSAVQDANDLSEWQTVLDLISARDDVFHVLPLTEGNTAVDQMFYQHILQMNDDLVGKERVLYLTDYTKRNIPLVIGGDVPLTGSVSVEELGDVQYAAFTDSDGVSDIDFIAANVRKGDVVRTNYSYDEFGNETYDAYLVEEVVNGQVLRLSAAVNSVVPSVVPVRYEIWRNRTNTELADVIANTEGIQDYRVRYIRVDNADPMVDPIGPAAALVGLIASVVPHQGVTWYPLTGWSADTWEPVFSNAELNHMASNGVLIITRHADGYVCARHAVTTAKMPVVGKTETSLDTMMFEEMYIRNALLIKKEFRRAFGGFIGVTNVSEATIQQIYANIQAVSDWLQNSSDYPHLGGRITGPIENLIVRQHAFLKDRVIASGLVRGAVPLNQLEFDVYNSL